MAELTPAASQLILKYEVGGGQKYYDKKAKHPVWPGKSSGVTIGVGYDLGAASASVFQADWGTRLAAADIKRLGRCLGTHGTAAKALVAGVQDITVPWAAASAVYFTLQVPRFLRTAQRVFPGLDKLPGDARGGSGVAALQPRPEDDGRRPQRDAGHS